MAIKIREMFTIYFIGHVHVLPSFPMTVFTILDLFTLCLYESAENKSYVQDNSSILRQHLECSYYGRRKVDCT